MAAMLRHSRICTQHFVSWRHDTLRSVRSWRAEENQTRDRGNSWGENQLRLIITLFLFNSRQAKTPRVVVAAKSIF